MAVKTATRPTHKAILPGDANGHDNGHGAGVLSPCVADVAREIFVTRIASSASRATTTPHIAKQAFEDARIFVREAQRQLAAPDADPDEPSASYEDQSP